MDIPPASQPTQDDGTTNASSASVDAPIAPPLSQESAEYFAAMSFPDFGVPGPGDEDLPDTAPGSPMTGVEGISTTLDPSHCRTIQH